MAAYSESKLNEPLVRHADAPGPPGDVPEFAGGQVAAASRLMNRVNQYGADGEVHTLRQGRGRGDEFDGAGTHLVLD
jgi:hypothetical protein